MTEETRTEDVRVKLTPSEKTILGEICEREDATSSEAIGHLLVMYALNYVNKLSPAADVPEWEPFKPIPQPEQPTGKQRKRGGN